MPLKLTYYNKGVYSVWPRINKCTFLFFDEHKVMTGK